MQKNASAVGGRMGGALKAYSLWALPAPSRTPQREAALEGCHLWVQMQ